MNQDLKNLKFNTKTIMITEKQKRMIELLLDELLDYNVFQYENVKYWEMTKQEASKFISKLMNKLNKIKYFGEDYSFEAWYEHEVEE